MSLFGGFTDWITGDSTGATFTKTAILGYIAHEMADNTTDTSEAPDEGVRLQLNTSTENKITVLYGDADFG